jgi:hypothetical protein
MTTCVLFNDKNEFVNVIVAEPYDWVDEGWRLEEIKPGFTWDGEKIVPVTGVLTVNDVKPEVI